MSSSNAGRSMPSSTSFSAEQLVGDAVEEQVDRENDDDQIVEAARGSGPVRHEIAPEREVADRSGEKRLARRRRALVGDERAASAERRSVPGWPTAGTPSGRTRARAPTDPAVARLFEPPRAIVSRPPSDSVRCPRTRLPPGRGVYQPTRDDGRIRQFPPASGSALTSNVRSVSCTDKEVASDQARRGSEGQDPRLHRRDAACPRLPTVGPGDREGGRSGVHVGRPSPPPDPRARGLPGARRRPVARDPPHPVRRAAPRACWRARARRQRPWRRTCCRSSARSPPAVRSRRTKTPRRRSASRTCSRRRVTRTSSRSAAIR